MATYTPTTWEGGDPIRAELLNKIEQQLADNTPGATNIANEWENNINYKKNDCVLYDGTLWRCLLSHAGVAPQGGQYWEPILLTENMSSQLSNMNVVLDVQDNKIKNFISTIFEYEWVDSTYYEQIITGSGVVDATSSEIRGVRITANETYHSIIFYLHKNDRICAPDFEEGDTSYYAMTIGENYSGEWSSTTAPCSLSCTNAIRLRKSEDNLPTLESPYIATGETVVIITVPVATTATYKILSPSDTLASHILLHNNQLDQIWNSQITMDDNLTIYYATTKYIYVYVPTFVLNYYLKYTIEHYVNANTDADMWLLRKCDLTSGKELDSPIIFPVVIEGQWEIALKMSSDTADHIGGKNHGSEVMLDNNLWFFLNGKLFTPTVGETYIGKTFSFMINSEMHYPSDVTTTVALHHNKLTFSLSNIEMEQSLEWKVSDAVRNSYICMLPLCRGSDDNTTYQVTDYGYDYLTFTPYDISQVGFDNYMKEYIIGRKKITEYGSTSGIEATAEIEGDFIEGQYGFIQNSGDKPTNAYNKIYLTYAPNNTEVQANDIWTWKNKYIITYTL